MTTMPDATHYTYRVAWSVEDREHVATVAEFPSLSWLAPTPVEALAGLAHVVRDVLADLAASGEPVPEPLSERAYSGRFVVRVPAEVHRRLAREAAEQHVSLTGSYRTGLRARDVLARLDSGALCVRIACRARAGDALPSARDRAG
jgi:predicted RNase H-like HicB family nuclease